MAGKKSSKNPENEKNNPKSKESETISLIENPYGFETLEITEDQNNPDFEQEIDTDSEEDAIDMSKLARAVADSDAAHAEEVSETLRAGLSEQEAQEELARQIAEDQALTQRMAEEAAQELEDENDPEMLAAMPNSEHLDMLEVQSCIEALLFMADKPVSAAKLRELLGPDFTLDIFKEALSALQERYKASHHGFEIAAVAGGYQFRTKIGRAPLARKLAKIQTQRLSSGGMESLAIIAYKQPVLKEEIDKIRGVDSSYFIRGLMDKKLIKISGRSELPGRPMLYSTTDEFLQIFGLMDLAAMPPLRELESMVPTSQAKNEEDPRVKELRRLVGQMNSDTSTTLNYDPKEDDKLLQEIRERVQSIPSSTPYLDEQKALEQAEGAERKQAFADRMKGREAKKLAELGELGAAMIADTLDASSARSLKPSEEPADAPSIPETGV
jgi:segregation and condensation protein B